MTDLKRRNFVKLGALSAAGVIAMGDSPLNASSLDQKGVKYDQEYDVVIIGSGFAALSAAITAGEKGHKVCILEKMGRYGGNSIINGGLFAIVNSPKQQTEGVKDSVDLYIKDLMKAGLNMNHPENLKIIATRGMDALKLTEKCGAKYYEKLSHLGGHSVPRTYITSVGSGAGIVQPMLAYAEKLPNVTLKNKVKFDDFIVDDTDRVVGVSVRENYKFDMQSLDDHRENKSGERKYIKATKGVILASGGFCRDIFMRNMQDPTIPVECDTTNHPGATGEVIMKALELGAVPIHLSWIQWGPWASPDEKGFGTASNFNINSTFRFGITVDPKTGKRFMNELADRRVRSLAMFKVIGEDKNYPINLCDQTAIDKSLPDVTEKALASGVVKKFNTLDELAAAYKIPAAELKKTIETYNGYVKAKKDPEFGKPVDNIEDVQIMKPPFYANRGVPKLHYTMGGLKINEKAQVISTKTKKPIAGLFAAGGVTGGVHGASRLGSCSIPDCLVFGMVAGENI